MKIPVFFLLIGLCISCVYAKKLPTDRLTCIQNLRQLDSATDQAAIEMNHRTGVQIPRGSISGYIRGGADALTCRSGGRYTFGTVGREPRCSVHGTIHDPNARGNPADVRRLWEREPQTETEKAVDQLLEQMSREQAQFDPIKFEEPDPETLHALADRFFPQAADPLEEDLSREEVEKRVIQLGADDFRERERATQQLQEATTPFRGSVRQAANSADPEVRQRALAVIAAWTAREEAWVHIDFSQYEEALRKTLEEMKDDDNRSILVRQAKLAQEAGPVNDSQKRLIDLCLP